jgi:photosystem II stability/assembly factor-like uncharacterized protein
MRRPLVRLAAVWIAIAAASVGCHQFDFSPRTAEGAIDIYDDLFAVSASDEMHTVAVGYHGAAYWTDDGGATWNKGETGTTMLLYSVSMADSQNGWAVGQAGTILRTADGGETWRDQPNLKKDEGVHLFGVHAIDASRAWAVGEWGTRIYTDDGGANWVDHSVLVTLDHPMFVWLSATDQERVREGRKVYEDVGLNDVFCLSPPSEMCWIIGEFGYIFVSEDAGQTWARGEVVGDVFMNPIRLPYNVIGLGTDAKAELAEFASHIEDETHLNVLIDVFVSAKEMADLGDEEDPYALFDLISARIDETKSVLEGAGILQDRMRMPNKPPWDFEDFVEHDPTFLKRYFEGRVADELSIKVAVIQNPYLFTVNFQDEHEGFISGLGGVVLRSSDGGKGWRYVTIDRKKALFSVAAGGSRVVTLGEKGLVRLSSDVGKSWLAPEPEDFPTVFTFMRDVDFERGRKVGYIVGQQGMILRSENGGKSWRKILPPGDLGLGRLL